MVALFSGHGPVRHRHLLEGKTGELAKTSADLCFDVEVEVGDVLCRPSPAPRWAGRVDKNMFPAILEYSAT